MLLGYPVQHSPPLGHLPDRLDDRQPADDGYPEGCLSHASCDRGQKQQRLSQCPVRGKEMDVETETRPTDRHGRQAAVSRWQKQAKRTPAIHTHHESLPITFL